MDVRTKRCVFLRPRWWEKLFDPWAFGRKGQECPRKSGPKSLCLCVFSFPDNLERGGDVERTGCNFFSSDSLSPTNRERKLNTNIFFLKLFGRPRDVPTNPGISRPKSLIPWFRGTYRTFWPPPVHVEDPYPTGKYPDQKVWVWVPLGACAMTTKFLDNQICTFKILLSWRFPQKQAFWDDFPLRPQGPPPSKAKILFLLSSRRL